MTVWIACGLVVAAVVVWPRGRARTPAGLVGAGVPTPVGWADGVESVLAADPVDLVGRCVRWARRHGRGRGSRIPAARVAELAEVLAPVLRAGVDPPRALRRVLVSAELGELAGVVEAAAAEAAAGGSAGGVLVRAAGGTVGGAAGGTVEGAGRVGGTARGTARERGPRSNDLALLGRAWLLSEQVGTPLAQAVRSVAEQVRRREASASALAAATAGPRASMAMLVLLPLAGPLVGLAFGLGPGELYARTPVGLGCLVVALALVGAGVGWSRALLRRAVRPAGAGR